MSGINVLSDFLKGGSKLEKTSGPKGKHAADSLDNTAGEFAAMLNGLTTMNADPNGQSSMVERDLENADNSDQSLGNLGYAQHMVPYLSQLFYLSDLPAGKEANSGNGVNQGTGGSMLSGNNFGIDDLSNFSPELNEVLSINGLTSQVPQDNNPGTTELDKYRQVIANLLEELSGQIQDSSSRETPLGLEQESNGQQQMLRFLQGLSTVAGDSSKNVQAANTQTTKFEYNSGQVISGQAVSGLADDVILSEVTNPGGDVAETLLSAKDSVSSSLTNEAFRQTLVRTVQDWLKGSSQNEENKQTIGRTISQPMLNSFLTELKNGNQEQNPQVSSVLTVVNQLLSQDQESNVPQQVRSETVSSEISQLESVGLPEVDNGRQPAKYGRSEPLHNLLKVLNHLSDATLKDNPSPTTAEQNVADSSLQTSKPAKGNLEITGEDPVNGEVKQSSEPSEPKASPTQRQDQSLGLGLAGSSVSVNIDGKTVAVPVWEQISNVLREQVHNQTKELKELDIQLHPAELGKIQIGLRWENGQVHLQVQASEAATSQILQNQLFELRHTLTSQGVNCGMLQMGQGGAQEQHQNHQGDQTPRNSSSYLGLDEDIEPLSVIQPSSPEEFNNRINVTA